MTRSATYITSFVVAMFAGLAGAQEVKSHPKKPQTSQVHTRTKAASNPSSQARKGTAPAQDKNHVYAQAPEADNLLNTEIANLPIARFVDCFKEAYYDLSYRAEAGNLSTWLTLEYDDGTVIDINTYEFIEQTPTKEPIWASMEGAYLGIGGRIFPRILTPETVPNLWVARQAAMSVIEQSNIEFILTSTEVVFVAVGNDDERRF